MSDRTRPTVPVVSDHLGTVEPHSAVLGTGHPDDVFLLERTPPHHVHRALTVGAHDAALPTTSSARRDGVGGLTDLALSPGVAPVGRASEHHRLRGAAESSAAEGNVAHVDVAEIGAGLGVVRPDRFLIGERGAALLRRDHRRHPGILVIGRRGLDIVGARNRDRLEALEPDVLGGVRERRRQVREVEAGAVAPRELAIGIWPRAEYERWVTV